jgi:cyclophilin family peptidyl-prolyl cis-trans isomerase
MFEKILEGRRKMIVVLGLCFVAVVIGYLALRTNDNKNVMATNINQKVSENYTGATIETNMGTFKISFYNDKSPETVKNFVSLAKKGFYENTKFHRVIKDFMIQGGDPNSKTDDKSSYGRGGPGYSFNDEISDVPLVKGVVAMANSGPNTNGSQFFVITAPATPWLQGKHTAFAKVIEGMDTVDKIGKVRTELCAGEDYYNPAKHCDLPLTPIVINKISLITN